MKQFLKENFALALGISLPLLLMVLFFVAGRTAQVTIDPPQYDAVFATNYNEGWANMPYRFQVDEGKLVIRFQKPEKQTSYYKPQLYVLDHETQYARLIDIDYDNVQDGKVQDPDLQALNKHKFFTVTGKSGRVQV